MDFEKAYEKFLNGSATPEEVEFVRSEMKKANDVNNVLNNVKNEGATNASEKDTVKILVIVCAAVLALAIAVSMAVGIPILSSAKGNVHYSKEDAKAIAVQTVSAVYPAAASKIEVLRVERELELEGRIKNARYVYVVDVYNGQRVLEIEIDSKTGKILDVDD